LGSFLENQSLYNKETTHYEWGNPERVSVPKNKVQNENTIIQAVAEKFDQSKIRIAKREALLWDTKQAEAIEYGNILHEIMAKVNQSDDVTNAIQNAVLNGIIADDQQEAVSKTCHEIINNPQLQNYFSSENTVYNERSILVKNGPTIKPDKVVFLEDKKVMILDYKTGSTETKHKDQINSYAYALGTMGYTVVQKVLVYVGVSIAVVLV
jgi:ATP-dependent exoDNAse (exonuclease V) beta subunit